MSGFSDYWENKILNHVFGKGSYTPPTIYVALCTADPLDDASGLAEPSGNGYGRVQTSASDWSPASDGALSNAAAVAFGAAAGSWGTITHFALFDAATGGNMLACGALNHSKAIGSSNTARFEAGDLNLRACVKSIDLVGFRPIL